MGWAVQPLCILLSVIGFSCASVDTPIVTEPLESGCARVTYLRAFDSEPIGPLDPSPLLESRYSRSSLIVAHALGLTKQLEELEYLRDARSASGESDFDTRSELQRVVLVQQVADILNLGTTNVEAVNDWIDCREIELVRYRSIVESENSRRDRNLTRAAIATGGVTAVLVAGVLTSGDDDLKGGDTLDWIGVAGGLTATYLAFRSSKVDTTIPIEHPVNVVDAFWRGDNSAEIFSSPIWYLLNEKETISPMDVSIREKAIQSWTGKAGLLVDEEDQGQLEVLIGAGGIYDVSMLDLRLALLGEIGTAVNSLDLAFFRLYEEMRR